MNHFRDYTGHKFGRLTALRFTGKRTTPSNNSIWVFQCDCGNVVERTIPWSSTKVPSCGCYVKERMSNLNKTHGGRHDRLYLVWMGMRRRCFDKNANEYKNYGGRGITVCDEWKDYAKFREWAMTSGYDETAKRQGCTIDRIDVNGNYEPQNCRWADAKTQNNNRRNNRLVEYNNETKTLKQWSEELGLDYELILRRINSGWKVERAFSQKRRIVHRET